MENEDPAITFDRVAGECAMYRQLLSLLLGNSPAAMKSLRLVTPELARDLMLPKAVSDVFIESALDAYEDIKKRAEVVALLAEQQAAEQARKG